MNHKIISHKTIQIDREHSYDYLVLATNSGVAGINKDLYNQITGNTNKVTLFKAEEVQAQLKIEQSPFNFEEKPVLDVELSDEDALCWDIFRKMDRKIFGKKSPKSSFTSKDFKNIRLKEGSVCIGRFPNTKTQNSSLNIRIVYVIKNYERFIDCIVIEPKWSVATSFEGETLQSKINIELDKLLTTGYRFCLSKYDLLMNDNRKFDTLYEVEGIGSEGQGSFEEAMAQVNEKLLSTETQIRIKKEYNKISNKIKSDIIRWIENNKSDELKDIILIQVATTKENIYGQQVLQQRKIS